MGPEDLALPPPGALVVEIIEARLPDPDHLRMLGQFHQTLGIDRGFVRGFVRMDSDRTADPRVTLGNGQHLRKLGYPRADGDQMCDAVGLGARQDLWHPSGKVRKIEMAVAVDQPSIHAAVSS